MLFNWRVLPRVSRGSRQFRPISSVPNRSCPEIFGAAGVAAQGTWRLAAPSELESVSPDRETGRADGAEKEKRSNVDLQLRGTPCQARHLHGCKCTEGRRGNKGKKKKEKSTVKMMRKTKDSDSLQGGAVALCKGGWLGRAESRRKGKAAGANLGALLGQKSGWQSGRSGQRVTRSGRLAGPLAGPRRAATAGQSASRGDKSPRTALIAGNSHAKADQW